MYDSRPGLNSQRLVRLMQQAIERCQLQLDNLTVLTEAATGAYAVTPVIAAIAGAKKVFAIARSSRYGTLEQVASPNTGTSRNCRGKRSPGIYHRKNRR